MTEIDRPAPLTVELVEEYLGQIDVWKSEIIKVKGATALTSDEFLKLRNRALEQETRLIPLVYAKLGIAEFLPHLRNIPFATLGLTPENEGEFQECEPGLYYSIEDETLRLARRFLIAEGPQLSAITVISNPTPITYRPSPIGERIIDGDKANASLLYKLLKYVETRHAAVFGWIPISPTSQSPSYQDPSQP